MIFSDNLLKYNDETDRINPAEWRQFSRIFDESSLRPKSTFLTVFFTPQTPLGSSELLPDTYIKQILSQNMIA